MPESFTVYRCRMNEKLSDPKKTIEVIQKYQFAFQKRFGQNFLIDAHVLEKIVSAAGITKDDCVLEIGPGIGTMTQYLAESAGQVIAVEIDTNLLPILADTLKDYSNVKVINQDILKVDINELVKEYNNGRPIKVVANLPYYITTPIIMGLFESNVPIDNITVMVQKEVADRMQVGPGSKDYGALSLAVQYYASPYIVANVPPVFSDCFSVFILTLLLSSKVFLTYSYLSKLLYPKTKCRFRGDPSDPLSGAAGTGKRSEADVQADSRIL